MNHNKFVLDRSRRQFNVRPQKRAEADKSRSPSLCTMIIQKASLTYFAQNYYGRWLSCVQIKILVLFVCAVQLFLAGYGCIKVKRGLNVTDVMTPGTAPYDYLSAERKYFSFQYFYIALKSEENGKMFNFSTIQNQGRIWELHNKIKKLKNVSPTVDMWLTTYSTWLKDAETSFISQWNSGNITHSCMRVHDYEVGEEDDRQFYKKCNASKPARIIYRLLETAVLHDQYPKTISSNWTRIVDNDGVISPRWFYDGLTFWYYYDEKGREKSKISLRPVAENRPRLDDYYLPGEDTLLPEIMLMPYAATNLTDDEDYITLIEDVRGVCDEFWRMYSLSSYPIGKTFKFWDQFTFVEGKLLLAGSVVLGSVGLLILITFMSLRAAIIVVFFLLVTMLEVYGVLGWLHIEVNVISAITLIVAVGVAGEFTVHTVLAFINTPGERNDRMRGALEITFAPLIDSAVSTIIMILVLSTSQYSFVIKYFFVPIVCLMCTALINGVLVLPVVLSFFGPCCEITNNSIRPTMNPIFHIPIDITINIDVPHVNPPPRQWMSGYNHHHPSNLPVYLSTIQEVSERSTPTIKTIYDEHRTSTGGSNKSSRPGTPFFPATTMVAEEFDGMPSPGDEKIDKATFKDKSKTSAWHHTPQLHQNEEFSPRLSKQINKIRQLPPGSLRNKKRNRNNASESNSDANRNGNTNVNSNDNHTNNKHLQSTICVVSKAEGYVSNALSSNNTVVGPRYTVGCNKDSNIIINNSDNSINSSNSNIINNSNNNRSPLTTHPRVIRVQPLEDSNSSRCSTKVKATLSIEVTHPYTVTSSTCHEEYDSGLTRVDY